MTKTPNRWIAIPALLALLVMLGCQGVSVGKSADSNPVGGELTATPNSLNFTNVQTGTNQSQTVMLANAGTGSVNITQATVTGAGFSISGLSLPLSLSAGQNTTFQVNYSPTSTGSVAGNVSVTSDGSVIPINISLFASAIAAGSISTSPTSFSFGNVPVGGRPGKTETITNTGAGNVTITGVGATGAFAAVSPKVPLTLTPNETVSFSVYFDPTAVGATTGMLAITISGLDTPVDLSLSGTGVAAGTLSASPSSFTFSGVQVGQSQSQTETLQNNGGTNVDVSQVTASGTGFSVSGFTPVTLTPGQSTTFSVKFAPQSAGTFSGSVVVASDGSNPSISLGLSGTSVTVATLTPNPASFTFSNVAVGQNSSQTETLKNTGGSSLTISQATASGTGFSITGITTPLTLASGQSTTFGVNFAPQSAGTFSGSIAITSDASNPSLTLGLSGTSVATGALSPNPVSFTFSNITVGQNSSQTETLKNTGGSSVTISQATASGAGFSITGITTPLTLASGQSTTFGVNFAPLSAGTFTGSISITSDAPNPSLTLGLSGTSVAAATLTPNPASMTFTSVTTGQSQSQTQVLKNTGGTSLTISQATATGTGFSISGITTPLTLTAGQSTSFSVTFAPQTSGTFSGSIAVTSNASNPNVSIGLSGTASAPTQSTLTVTSTVPVGSVVVGTNGTATGTLTASGGSVSVSSVTLGGTNPSEFSVTGLSFPVTVAPGTPVNFTVKFTPGATGSASATASFASNASNSPAVASLTGTGAAAPVHSVKLTWTASTTSDVTSYNIYRSLFSGGACASFGSAYSSSATTSFTDNTVTDGDTYCYATTSVDPNGESTMSNTVQAAIPAP
jgi:Abnormal spindle-like microcephaly-assoc'd, ASPM-SPD-2-Hydin